jgi:hypothetical protein
VKLCMCSRCSDFFCFWIGVGVGVGGGFFHFPSFSMSSHHVPNGFSSHSQFVLHVLNIFPKMFPMASHRIPNLFRMFSIFSPRCSQWVLITFPICSACSQYFPQDVPNAFSSHSQFVPHVLNIFPKMFPIALLFYLICFDKCCPPLTYIASMGQRGGTPPFFYSGDSCICIQS